MLILNLILCITSCTGVVYNITPTYEWTYHKSEYYFNTIKYFVSNTHLHFSQGTHELYSNFVIQDVSNISLIGEMQSSFRMQSRIHCNSSANIILRNVTNLMIKNIIFSNCQTRDYDIPDIKLQKSRSLALISIFDCYNVYVYNITLDYAYSLKPIGTSLLIINVLGKSVLDSIRSNELGLIYTDSGEVLRKQVHKLIICNYNPQYFDHEIQNEFNESHNDETFSISLALSLTLEQNSYSIIIKLVNKTFCGLNYNTIVSVNSSSHQNNVILIENCTFDSNSYSVPQSAIMAIKQSVCKSNLEGNSIIEINNCTFTNNECQGDILAIDWMMENCLMERNNGIKPGYRINNCLFENNSALVLARLKATAKFNNDIVIHVTKSQFMKFKDYRSKPPLPIAAIIALNIELYFSEMVTFCEVFVKYGLLHTDEVIFISNNVTFYNKKL